MPEPALKEIALQETVLKEAAGERPPDAEPCPNCGAEAVGPYCYRCGQRYSSHIVPLRTLLAEAVTAVFSLDNRLWRTLKKLLLRPGALTEAYLRGERIRYVSPLRLYLMFSVLYFFVAALIGTTNFLFFEFGAEGDAGEFGRLLPRLMFLIVPGFALLLKGIYRRQQRLFAEHLIFALHVHAFWYILFTAVALLEPVAQRATQDGQITLLTVVIALVYIPVQLGIPVSLFMAMRRVYGQSRGKTFGKIVVLYLGFFLLLGLVFSAFLLVREVF